MTKLKNLNCDKIQNLKLWQNSETKNVTKLKNSNCEKKLKNSNGDELKLLQNSKPKIVQKKMWPNSKTQIVTKVKKNSKTQIVTKLKNSKCDKTLKL